MCVDERFVDVYPDGDEKTFREITFCHRSRARRPCENVVIRRNDPRKIRYGEPTTEYIMSQISTPRSSTSSLRASSPMMYEIINETPARPRGRRESKSYNKEKKRESFLLNAMFGSPSPTRKSKTYVKTENHVHFADDTPLPPPPPPAPVPRHSAQYLSPRRYSRPLTPPRDTGYVYTPVPPSPLNHNSTRKASPRGRSPVIVDTRHRHKRSDSTDAVISDRPSPPSTPRDRRASDASTTKPTKKSKHRTESPTLSEIAAEDAERELLRRIRRDERTAKLEAELAQKMEQREREKRRAKLDAEIMARPPVPPSPTSPHRLPRFDVVEPVRRVEERGRRRDERVVLEQTARLQGVLADAELSRRGERVILEAMEERRRVDGAVRAAMIGAAAPTIVNERDERLRRRFDGATSGSLRRKDRQRGRIVYDDGTMRYE